MLSAFQEIDKTFPWFFTGTFFVLGAIVGSFLNVCIFRIPKGESVVFPSSHCACGKSLPIGLNIPIISWLWLRGRAACCGRKISMRYPAVELLTALVFASAWHFSEWNIAVPVMVFSVFAIVLAFIDWDTMYLPDSVNAGFVIVGLICAAVFPHHLGAESALDGFLASLVGLGVGSMLVFWFRFFATLLLRREAMGEGDIILLGGIGAFLGWQGAVFSFFGSSFVGLFAVLLMRIFSRGRLGKNQRAREAANLSLEGDDESAERVFRGESSPIPLGPWLLISAAIYIGVAEDLFRALSGIF